MPEFSENRALDPTRPYDDTPEVHLELGLLVNGSMPDETGLIRRLTTGPVEHLAPEEKKTAVLFNRLVDARGYVPAIVFDGDSCSLVPDARARLITVFATDHGSKDPEPGT